MKNIFIKTILILSGLLLTSKQVVARIEPLSEDYQQQLLKKHLWYPECPVSLSRLREVTVAYYDFHNNFHTDGKLVVLDAMATQTEEIFKELEMKHFPIEKIRPTSDYQGDDEMSMEDNNTSAFNCRPVTGKTNIFSLHAYGVAIDVNPKQNPYLGFDEKTLGSVTILPKNATNYVNRIFHVPGSAEDIVTVFSEHGFTEWGGSWHKPIDYQHFQVPRATADALTKKPE